MMLKRTRAGALIVLATMALVATNTALTAMPLALERYYCWECEDNFDECLDAAVAHQAACYDECDPQDPGYEDCIDDCDVAHDAELDWCAMKWLDECLINCVE
jgi:hypothetical protein